MGASFMPIFLMTSFWGVIGVVLPFYVPKNNNQGILQLILMLTGACCWLFWLCCYMAQMNPLIGPKLKNSTVLLIYHSWVRIFAIYENTWSLSLERAVGSIMSE